MKINDIFNSYISENLTLSQKDIEETSRSRRWVIDRVMARIKAKSDYPQLYAQNGQEFIHFGSYFKGTKVSNVDEFDVMLIIDSNEGVYKIDGEIIGTGVGKIYPNPKYKPNMIKNDLTGVDPQKLLDWLKLCIDEALLPYGCQSSIKDGQAVTVNLVGKGYAIDFVPGGIFTRINTGDRFFVIPDGNGWLQTEPTIDKVYINEIAKIFKQFKSAIRLMKHIRDNYLLDISSYAIECAFVHFTLTDKRFTDDFEYDFINFLYYLVKLIEQKYIADIRDSSINTISDVSTYNAVGVLCMIINQYNSIDKESMYFSHYLERVIKNEWNKYNAE